MNSFSWILDHQQSTYFLINWLNIQILFDSVGFRFGFIYNNKIKHNLDPKFQPLLLLRKQYCINHITLKKTLIYQINQLFV